MSSEMTATLTSVVGMVLGVLMFGIAAIQLRQLRVQITQAKDAAAQSEKRRRQESTLSFYCSTLERRSQLREILPEDWSQPGVEQFVSSMIESPDPALIRSMDAYLGLLEMLAAGVNSEIYDLATVEQIGGARIRTITKNYQAWFAHRRQVTGSQTLYGELEELAAALRARRSDPGIGG